MGVCRFGAARESALKMLEMTGNGEFAETVERALYNGALAGISLNGDRFFYDNPLESRGTHERTPWFHCACCPPNIARLIGNLGAFVAGGRSFSGTVQWGRGAHPDRPGAAVGSAGDPGGSA